MVSIDLAASPLVPGREERRVDALTARGAQLGLGEVTPRGDAEEALDGSRRRAGARDERITEVDIGGEQQP